jgi:hypothetical protein
VTTSGDFADVAAGVRDRVAQVRQEVRGDLGGGLEPVRGAGVGVAQPDVVLGLVEQLALGRKAALSPLGQRVGTEPRAGALDRHRGRHGGAHRSVGLLEGQALAPQAAAARIVGRDGDTGLGGAEVDAQRRDRATGRAQAVQQALLEVGSVHRGSPGKPPLRRQGHCTVWRLSACDATAIPCCPAHPPGDSAAQCTVRHRGRQA